MFPETSKKYCQQSLRRTRTIPIVSFAVGIVYETQIARELHHFLSGIFQPTSANKEDEI